MAKRVTSLRKQAQQEIVSKLMTIGKEVMEDAFKTADFKKDKTQNLHDSYGCAVYHNGLLVKNTIQFLTPKATVPRHLEGKDVYGHQDVIDYLKNYQPRSKGFQLVVIASIQYAGILEAGPVGNSNLKRKYKVISGINEAMLRYAKDLGGKRSRRKEGRYVIRHIKDE